MKKLNQSLGVKIYTFSCVPLVFLSFHLFADEWQRIVFYFSLTLLFPLLHLAIHRLKERHRNPGPLSQVQVDHFSVHASASTGKVHETGITPAPGAIKAKTDLDVKDGQLISFFCEPVARRPAGHQDQAAAGKLLAEICAN